MDNHGGPDDNGKDTAINWPDFSVILEKINSLKPVPDIARAKKAGEFISMAERFSEDFGIKAEIRKEKVQISLWLYFSDLLMRREMKDRFLELMGLADEMMIIPRLKDKEDCAFIVTLDYMTHHVYLNGEDLNPF